MISSLDYSTREAAIEAVKAAVNPWYQAEEEMKMFGRYPAKDENNVGEYIVWSPSSTVPPKMVYETKANAIKAAYGLANRFVDQKFYVAKIEGVAAAVKVEYSEDATHTGRKATETK